MDLKGLIIAGYGGHTAYALAVVNELLKYGVRVDVVLAKGYEYLAKKFENYGNILYLTLPRRPKEPLYRTIPRWIKSSTESLEVFRRNYDFVFAAGSNFSIPLSILYKIKGTPLYVVEDIYRLRKPAKTVDLLYRLNATVFLHWDDQLRLYPRGVVTGPIYEPRLYEPVDSGYILVTTGTIGDRDLFNTVIELSHDYAVLQTGDIDPKSYVSRRPKWKFFRFAEDLHKWIANASVVITHPGVTAITARLAYAKPVVLIYTRRHSHLYTKEEVKAVAEKIGATYLDDITLENLIKAIDEAKTKPLLNFANGAVRIAKLITSKSQS